MNVNGLIPKDALDYIEMSSEDFRLCVANDRRIGQEWYNRLSGIDQLRLRNKSTMDPFYSNSWIKVLKALSFLLDAQTTEFEIELRGHSLGRV